MLLELSPTHGFRTHCGTSNLKLNVQPVPLNYARDGSCSSISSSAQTVASLVCRVRLKLQVRKNQGACRGPVTIIYLPFLATSLRYFAVQGGTPAGHI
ncbi:hypothetical protein SERLADRAFT_401598 [Serpula lacrymans var. lacrymans S7.9]|uniref:Uncharacterized protein n=1 Tax=Serpula lacrymans var. lacrymans (strain S7.9) TaxID=578457 RepID=F8PA77_SERL9|nr:uncharacterized protein SERLADRAFT_401598 [Serpula lacrymans var. lacrymans S7.9]EGO20074.1 hypothetical protein SERLADRAFT_401598 [Serpula lacrymans var. lacrymans S7.9]